MTNSEVKDAIDEFGTAFMEFKQRNDERLAQIERRGHADPLLSEQVDRIGADLDRVEMKAVRRPSVGEVLHARLERLPETKARKAFVGYCRAGRDQLSGDEQKSLVMSDDTSGAYLATTEYVAELIKAAVLVSPVRQLARVRPTTHRSLAQPKRTQTAAARWAGETDKRLETQNPAYGLEEIPAHELIAVTYVSAAQLEDSAFDVEAELGEEFTEQFGLSEGQALLTGNGVGKPFGLLDPSQNVTSINSGTAADIADASGQADGLINMVHDLKEVYAQRATFGFNRKTLGALRKLKDAQKRYIFQPSPAVGMPNTILDSPYLILPDMPDVAANAYPIAYGDWRKAMTIADRLTLAVVRDALTQAENGLVKFVGRRRVGGKVVLPEALRLLKCSL